MTRFDSGVWSVWRSNTVSKVRDVRHRRRLFALQPPFRTPGGPLTGGRGGKYHHELDDGIGCRDSGTTDKRNRNFNLDPSSPSGSVGLIFPILLDPVSRTLWNAIELLMRSPQANEIRKEFRHTKDQRIRLIGLQYDTAHARLQLLAPRVSVSKHGWSRGEVWSSRRPVKPEVAGSNPVGTAVG